MDFVNAYSIDNISFLIEGTLTTLKLASIAVFFSLIFGSILGFLRFTKIPIISHLSTIYIECMRNIPPLLTIFFVFFALPNIGVNFDKFPAATIALIAYGSALMAETARAGFQSIELGQYEAARSQGLNYMQTMFLIYLPQAIKKMIPDFLEQVIILVKNTSIVVIISLEELTRSSQIIYSDNVDYVFPIIILVTFIYFIINFSISIFSKILDGSMSLPWRTKRNNIEN